MMNKLCQSGLAFAAALIVIVSSTALAQDAREYFQRGDTAYQQGDYDAAIASWNQAWTLDPRPLIQYNLSRAYQNLGRLQEAEAALDLYLEHADPNDENQANARALRSSIRERIARTGIVVTGGPDGATILVDGQEWGRTPRPDRITIEPGSHQIAVQREGYRDFRSSVVVPAGETVSVTIEMEATGDVGGGGGGDRTPPPDSGGPGIAPWLVVAGGGALIVGGAIVGLIALGQANDATTADSPEADTARGLALVADILAFTGTVAVAAGLVWFFLASRSSGDDDVAGLDLDVYPVVGPDVAGAGASLRF
jgi:hypothetical protein